MSDLIEALQIFLKYKNEKYPTHCEHDILMIMGVEENLEKEDEKRLNDLGFYWNDEGYWCSYRFGSA
jgi:hypothetical protein